jgi:electron transfer flavoprotein alpha/beta subunit
MHIQQTLIGSIEADAPLRESLQSVIVLHIGPERHQATVEAIRPAYVRGGSEIYLQREQFVGGAQGHDIAVDVYDSVKLG